MFESAITLVDLAAEFVGDQPVTYIVHAIEILPTDHYESPMTSLAFIAANAGDRLTL